MPVAGIWAGIAPRSFARLVAFPYHEPSLHDLGAFQVGIGATPLLALVWRDAPTVALSGFLTADTLQAVSHAIDLIQAVVPAICMPSARCRCWSVPPWCCGCASVAPSAGAGQPAGAAAMKGRVAAPSAASTTAAHA